MPILTEEFKLIPCPCRGLYSILDLRQPLRLKGAPRSWGPRFFIREKPPTSKTEASVTLAYTLQGHKIIAGGNAHGKRGDRSPTLKGAHPSGPWDAR